MTIHKVVATALLFISMSVLSHDCPNLIKQVDDLIASKPDLDEETIIDEDNLKNVKQLRNEGESLHQAGQHDESIEVLERALELLKNEV